MDKKDIILQILIVLALIGLFKIYVSGVKQVPVMVDSDYDPKMRYRFAVWFRTIYKEPVDMAYFPCPDGYKCNKLPPPKFREMARHIVFDTCGEKTDCKDALTWALQAYGVKDVDAYLSDKKW